MVGPWRLRVPPDDHGLQVVRQDCIGCLHYYGLQIQTLCVREYFWLCWSHYTRQRNEAEGGLYEESWWIPVELNNAYDVQFMSSFNRDMARREVTPLFYQSVLCCCLLHPVPKGPRAQRSITCACVKVNIYIENVYPYIIYKLYTYTILNSCINVCMQQTASNTRQ